MNFVHYIYYLTYLTIIKQGKHFLDNFKLSLYRHRTYLFILSQTKLQVWMSFGYKLEHYTPPLLTLMLPEPSKVKLTTKACSCKGTKRNISYISTDSFHLLQTSDEQYGFPVTYKYTVLLWLLKFYKSKKFYFVLYLCYLKFYFYYISHIYVVCFIL